MVDDVDGDDEDLGKLLNSYKPELRAFLESSRTLHPCLG